MIIFMGQFGARILKWRPELILYEYEALVLLNSMSGALTYAEHTDILIPIPYDI